MGRKDKVKLDILDIDKDIYIMELDINYLNNEVKTKVKSFYESYNN